MERCKDKMDQTSNSSVYNKARKRHICNETGKCDICPIHGGENARRSKHGAKKPRYKNKRK